MTEYEGAESRYMPACRDTAQIVPWYDFFVKASSSQRRLPRENANNVPQYKITRQGDPPPLLHRDRREYLDNWMLLAFANPKTTISQQPTSLGIGKFKWLNSRANTSDVTKERIKDYIRAELRMFDAGSTIYLAHLMTRLFQECFFGIDEGVATKTVK